MLTVWKYSVPVSDVFDLKMPVGTDPLCVAFQGNEARIWARVNPQAPLATHRFLLAGTGHVRADLAGARYLGTLFINEGVLVFHVFYAGKVEP
jgi:hypothetical protein